MQIKMLRWVILFVIYSISDQLQNTRSSDMVVDNDGNPVKPLVFVGNDDDRFEDFFSSESD